MELLKILTLFAAGGAVYVCIELLWRGRSHWSMALDGGVCFVLIGLLDELAPGLPLSAQSMLGAAVVSGSELLLGLTVNRSFAVWDYRGLPHNLCGQVCPQYFSCWALLSIAAAELDDVLRLALFGEALPVWRPV